MGIHLRLCQPGHASHSQGRTAFSMLPQFSPCTLHRSTSSSKYSMYLQQHSGQHTQATGVLGSSTDADTGGAGAHV